MWNRISDWLGVALYNITAWFLDQEVRSMVFGAVVVSMVLLMAIGAWRLAMLIGFIYCMAYLTYGRG